MLSSIDKKAQGKKNRKDGAMFESKVRKNLEFTGFHVVKFQNNLDTTTKKMIVAKSRWLYGRPMGMGFGFPDFLVFDSKNPPWFVECKTNNTLSKEEKIKMQLLKDMGFNCFVAYKDEKKPRDIKYREFLEYKEQEKVCRDKNQD